MFALTLLWNATHLSKSNEKIAEEDSAARVLEEFGQAIEDDEQYLSLPEKMMNSTTFLFLVFSLSFFQCVSCAVPHQRHLSLEVLHWIHIIFVNGNFGRNCNGE